MTNKLLMGNEAIAHAALEAGVGVVAGYPGTPSSEIVETVARQRDRGAAHGVHVEWSANEKVALEVLFGASLAGKRALLACKQTGLNVACNALISLNYASANGGLVLVVADDPGPISSQTEQDTRRFASFAKVPVLDPATPEQAFHMVKAAFDLSEHFRTPVIVRSTTRISFASEFIDIEDETSAFAALEDGYRRDPAKWVISPRRAYEAHGEINHRLTEIAEAFSSEPMFAPFNTMDEAGESFTGEPTFGIMAGGVTAAYAREALRIVGQRARRAGIGIPAYRFMQIGTPYPFPDRAVSAFATGLADILVLEELDSVLEDELAMFAGRMRAGFNLHGRRTGEARERGENDVDDIVARIERFLGLTGRLSLHRLRGGEMEPTPVRLSARAEAELPDRPPVLCAGCPHRGAFFAVKQALDKEPVVMCGDVGCHALGSAQPLDAIDASLCMGAGITMAQGLHIAEPDKKAIAYIGDSAFFSSGLPGLANAAYNGHDITVMVLDNATAALTGYQPHPGTGVTLMGERKEPLDIEKLLVANGFTHVFHANPFDRDASVIAVRAAVSHEGPSAVVFEGPCAQLAEPQPPVVINRDICTGCKRCITGIGCPAISFNASIDGPRSRDRGQAVIDPSLCTGCGLCTQVCPFHAIHGDPMVYRGTRASRSVDTSSYGLRPGNGARIMESGMAPSMDSVKQGTLAEDDRIQEDARAGWASFGAPGRLGIDGGAGDVASDRALPPEDEEESFSLPEMDENRDDRTSLFQDSLDNDLPVFAPERDVAYGRGPSDGFHDAAADNGEAFGEPGASGASGASDRDDDGLPLSDEGGSDA